MRSRAASSTAAPAAGASPAELTQSDRLQPGARRCGGQEQTARLRGKVTDLRPGSPLNAAWPPWATGMGYGVELQRLAAPASLAGGGHLRAGPHGDVSCCGVDFGEPDPVVDDDLHPLLEFGGIDTLGLEELGEARPEVPVDGLVKPLDIPFLGIFC